MSVEDWFGYLVMKQFFMVLQDRLGEAGVRCLETYREWLETSDTPTRQAYEEAASERDKLAGRVQDAAEELFSLRLRLGIVSGKLDEAG